MKIYFDMDGVLVDFDSVRPDTSDFNHPSEELSPEMRTAKKQFWRDIEQQENFWRDIPVMVNAEHLLSVAKSVGEIFILSKTPSAKHFITGQKYVDFVADEKRKWALKNFGNFFDGKHIIICTGNKGELVKPSSEDILVDDRRENIVEWESCGGRGILFVNALDVAQQLQKQDFD